MFQVCLGVDCWGIVVAFTYEIITFFWCFNNCTSVAHRSTEASLDLETAAVENSYHFRILPPPSWLWTWTLNDLIVNNELLWKGKRTSVHRYPLWSTTCFHLLMLLYLLLRKAIVIRWVLQVKWVCWLVLCQHDTARVTWKKGNPIKTNGLVWLISLESCSFLKENGGLVDLREKGVETERKVVEAEVGVYWMREE